MPRLSDQERQEVMRYLEADQPLPEKYRFLLFEDKRQVELVWNGKTNTVCNVVLPFQTIEQVDEPRAEQPLDAMEALQTDLFSTIPFQPLPYLSYAEDQLREIVFRDISTGAVSHTTVLDPATVVDYRNVLGYFAQTLCQQTKLFSHQPPARSSTPSPRPSMPSRCTIAVAPRSSASSACSPHAPSW